MAWCQLKTQINTTQSEVNNATAMQVLERVLSRLDHRPGSPEHQTADDDDDDAVPARPRLRTPGLGWDVGQLPARPMPYMVFPECQDSVAALRSREDFVSATHQDRRTERLRRRALTVTRGHGSPSRGNPYAPLGELADLDQPAASRASPLRVVYPISETASKESKPRVPSHLRVGSAEQGRVRAREYKHYMVVMPPHRSLELVAHHLDAALLTCSMLTATTTTAAAAAAYYVLTTYYRWRTISTAPQLARRRQTSLCARPVATPPLLTTPGASWAMEARGLL